MKAYPDGGHVFSDARELGLAHAWCHRENRMVEVPNRVDILLAGFPCKSVSNLNSDPRSIDDVDSATGEGLQGVINYLKAHAPTVVVLENVRGLVLQQQKFGGSMVDKLMDKMHSVGYEGIYGIMNSKDFLLPQCRTRVWLYFKLRGAGGNIKHSVQRMEVFKRGRPFPLSAVLDQGCQPSKATLPKKRKAGRKPGNAFVAKHTQFAKMHGLHHLATLTKRKEAASTKVPDSMLTDRVRHTIVLMEAYLEKKHHAPEEEDIIMAVDQDIGRVPTQFNIAPCAPNLV
eukprot:11228302-Lingulodinium_polyedra.AAC.1